MLIDYSDKIFLFSYFNFYDMVLPKKITISGETRTVMKVA